MSCQTNATFGFLRCSHGVPFQKVAFHPTQRGHLKFNLTSDSLQKLMMACRDCLHDKRLQLQHALSNVNAKKTICRCLKKWEKVPAMLADCIQEGKNSLNTQRKTPPAAFEKPNSWEEQPAAENFEDGLLQQRTERKTHRDCLRSHNLSHTERESNWSVSCQTSCC